MMVRVRTPHSKRLLTTQEAAAYCGVSVAVFERTCPVKPISLARPGVSDQRLNRYDIVLLDSWIDALAGLATGSVEQKDWLAEV
jgi:hypothetical protein